MCYYGDMRLKWAGNVLHMGIKRKAYTALVWIREGKGPLGTLRGRRIILK
jgi:hypothetical protein